jgi:WD40 repeat protein
MKIPNRLLIFVLFISACAPVTPASTNIQSSSETQEFQDFSYRMTWSKDDSMIALTTITGLYVHDTKTYRQLAAFKEAAGGEAVFSDSYLAAFRQEKVFVWNLKDFSTQFVLDASEQSNFQSIAISPDETILLTAEPAETRYWNLLDGTLLKKVPSQNFITDMVFSEQNKVIMADSYFGTVQEWDTQIQKQVQSFGFSRPVVHLNLSQDGQLVVVDYGDYGFETWDVGTGTRIHEYKDIISAPGWNNLSGDHQRVVVWGYGIETESGLSVWDLDAYKKISEFSTPLVNGDGWRYGSLNSDGSILAASNNEGVIYFYDLKTNKTLGEIHLPTFPT